MNTEFPFAELNRAASWFVSKNNRHPTHVLLGEEELVQLQDHANTSQLYFYDENAVPFTRVLGMVVVPVKQAKYFAVALLEFTQDDQPDPLPH